MRWSRRRRASSTSASPRSRLALTPSAKIQTLAKGKQGRQGEGLRRGEGCRGHVRDVVDRDARRRGVDKATAGTIMGGIGQYSEYVTQVKTALKCK